MPSIFFILAGDPRTGLINIWFGARWGEGVVCSKNLFGDILVSCSSVSAVIGVYNLLLGIDIESQLVLLAEKAEMEMGSQSSYSFA